MSYTIQFTMRTVIVIKSRAFGVNNADLHIHRGDWAKGMPMMGIDAESETLPMDSARRSVVRRARMGRQCYSSLSRRKMGMREVPQESPDAAEGDQEKAGQGTGASQRQHGRQLVEDGQEGKPMPNSVKFSFVSDFILGEEDFPVGNILGDILRKIIECKFEALAKSARDENANAHKAMEAYQYNGGKMAALID
ncbi:hypothetical protein CONPUDRAFT_168236 [Coniophora puteana RWD-64-598 SS2]|uniref:Uncharacterized protein n=1 Tax=Coniophora puteana (strain RWD-64-598) TaxID=741705 RepID=A0A5M3MEM7_CONPW|nr:uncharacterized protein CONPUDRAFT_168236 [Coniophora puteana RWD-64-598 SS2]EIW77254.1 hypothetical protein CONPUDRAFT_168236 [Coniophora puteana RWD-64-598 SS2]